MAAQPLAVQVGVAPACQALGVSRATFYRRQRPTPGHQQPRPTPARALCESEREHVLDVLAWLWTVYGDCDEVVFHYAPSRAHRHVHVFLGNFRGTLLSDGYDGYSAYAAQRLGEVTHALCWSHTRRTFERAKDSEPEAAAEALALIGAMYAHEKQIRADALTGQDKRAYRQTHNHGS